MHTREREAGGSSLGLIRCDPLNRVLWCIRKSQPLGETRPLSVAPVNEEILPAVVLRDVTLGCDVKPRMQIHSGCRSWNEL